MAEQLDASLSSLSINDSSFQSEDWDRALITSETDSSSHSRATKLSNSTPRNSVIFPVDSDTTPSRSRTTTRTVESPTREGKRSLSELLKLHAEKGTDVRFSAEEASRLADVLGQWINASSSPYEGEDDFFNRSQDDLSIPNKKSMVSESRPRGQSESANSRPPSSTGFVTF
ncbi:hypothetical protein H0H87_007173 [Tephrocybe sp. NHM501043]|nr:hypothetical protein H0H87_007173 [Tephrocybe sp. NHM501043]